MCFLSELPVGDDLFSRGNIRSELTILRHVRRNLAEIVIKLLSLRAHRKVTHLLTAKINSLSSMDQLKSVDVRRIFRNLGKPLTALENLSKGVLNVTSDRHTVKGNRLSKRHRVNMHSHESLLNCAEGVPLVARSGQETRKTRAEPSGH